MGSSSLGCASGFLKLAFRLFNAGASGKRSLLEKPSHAGSQSCPVLSALQAGYADWAGLEVLVRLVGCASLPRESISSNLGAAPRSRRCALVSQSPDQHRTPAVLPRTTAFTGLSRAHVMSDLNPASRQSRKRRFSDELAYRNLGMAA